MPDFDALIPPKREQLAAQRRVLPAHEPSLIDVSSKDYLGLARLCCFSIEDACAWTRRHGAGIHAALATLIENNEVINASRRAALPVCARIEDLAADPRVGNIHNTGMIWASNVATDDPLFARCFQLAAMANGRLLCPIRSTVQFMPPYVIGKRNSPC